MRNLIKKRLKYVAFPLLTLGLLSLLATGCQGGLLEIFGEKAKTPEGLEVTKEKLPEVTELEVDKTTLYQPEGEGDREPPDESVFREPADEKIEEVCPKMQEDFGRKAFEVLRGDPCDEYTAVNINTSFLYPELFNLMTNKVALLMSPKGTTEPSDDTLNKVGQLMNGSDEMAVCRKFAKESLTEEEEMKIDSGKLTATLPAPERKEFVQSAILLLMPRENVNFLDILMEGQEIKENIELRQKLTTTIPTEERSIDLSGLQTSVKDNFFAIGSGDLIADLNSDKALVSNTSMPVDYGRTPKNNLLRSFRIDVPDKDPDALFEKYGIAEVDRRVTVIGESISLGKRCVESEEIVNDMAFGSSVEVGELTSSIMQDIVDDMNISFELAAEEPSPEETSQQLLQQDKEKATMPEPVGDVRVQTLPGTMELEKMTTTQQKIRIQDLPQVEEGAAQEGGSEYLAPGVEVEQQDIIEEETQEPVE